MVQYGNVGNVSPDGNVGNVSPDSAGYRTRLASRHVRDARAMMHVGIDN